MISMSGKGKASRKNLFFFIFFVEGKGCTLKP